MADLHAIRNIIGIIGNVISFLLFVSPMPTFQKIVKKKDVEQYSPNPYLAAVMNCSLWVFYGMPFVHPDSTLVITINGIGLGLELCYVIVFFIFSDTKRKMHIMGVLTVEILSVATVVVATLLAFHTTDRRSMVVGIICVIFNILMYAMPLDVMLLVIRTKSVKYMPFYLLLCNFVNGCVWVTYALLKFDLYILISNASGLFLGAIQLTLYATYYKNSPSDCSQGVQLTNGGGDRYLSV